MLTHFDANAVSVSRTIKISVISLLGRRKMLHRDILINGVMPRETPQRTAFQRQRMATGIGTFTPILGRMNGNITRAHRLARPTSRPIRKVIVLDPNLPHETGCTDPTASNYNADADKEDDSCIYNNLSLQFNLKNKTLFES